MHDALAHAAGKLRRIAALEAPQARPCRNQPPGPGEPLGFRCWPMPTSSSGKATLSMHRCATERWTPPGTPCRLQGAGRRNDFARDGDAGRLIVAVCSPPMRLNRVDLPQPDGPITDNELAGRNGKRHMLDCRHHAVGRDEPGLDDVVDLENGSVLRQLADARATVCGRPASARVLLIARCRAMAPAVDWRACGVRSPRSTTATWPSSTEAIAWPSTCPSIVGAVVHRGRIRCAPWARAMAAMSICGIGDALADPLVLDRSVAHAVRRAPDGPHRCRTS